MLIYLVLTEILLLQSMLHVGLYIKAHLKREKN